MVQVGEDDEALFLTSGGIFVSDVSYFLRMFYKATVAELDYITATLLRKVYTVMVFDSWKANLIDLPTRNDMLGNDSHSIAIAESDYLAQDRNQVAIMSHELFS